MRRRFLYPRLSLVSVVLIFVTTTNVFATALDDYVATPDPAYSWQLASVVEGEGYKALVIDMKSQTWRKPEEVNRTLWEHWVIVVIPQQVEHDTAMMFIGGGGNGRPAPTAADGMLLQFAKTTHSVVAEVKQIPNQPLSFHGESKQRVEDEIIAYTWDQFARTGDPTWAARLPMTKAVVRAMDTVQEAVKQNANIDIKKFVVAGGSKRGWTTWTTAAVDKRVVAIAPIVIDVLNVKKSLEHHFRAYGFWAPAIGDYVTEGVVNWYETPEFDALMQLVDPYSYRERYTMPKFILNASGDQFFLPDSSQFYFNDLPREKFLRYVPNTDHGLKNSNAPESLCAWYAAILNNVPRPEFTWKKRLSKKQGVLRVKAVTKPTKVVLWQATNPEARDFRLESFGPNWKDSILEPNNRGDYVAKIPAPEKGWTAFFVELSFDNPGFPPLVFTTEVGVVPDVLPFEKPPSGPAPKP